MKGWMNLVDDCPTCAHHFERQEGYWVGAVAINTVVTIIVFGIVFIGGMVVTWPEVPWNALLVVTVAMNLVFPILFYPWSKTLWVALDLAIHRVDRE